MTTHTTTAPFAQLDAAVTGRVLLPGTPEYAALATPWNVAVPVTAAAVVEVADAADISAVMRFAAEHDLQVSVQATGHGAVAADRPAILVHTGALKELSVRPDGTVRAGAGVVWAEVIEAAAPYGLAPLCGSSPGVGVVGLLTGGGIGPVVRSYGVSSDRVVAFDVVTGDGRIHHVDRVSRPDLFWALRGGKGTLGIVTAVEFELVALPELFGGCVFFDGADTAAVMSRWAQWTATLPNEATSSIAVLRLPPMPGIPEPLAGKTTVTVRFAWTGDPDAGRAVFAPMLEAGRVLLGGVDTMPYAAIGMIHMDPPDPMPSRESTALLNAFPADAIDALLALTGPDVECPQIMVEVRHLGGAYTFGPAEGDAFDHRDAAYVIELIGLGVPPVVDAVIANADQVLAALRPWSTGGTLPNFGPSTDPVAVAAKYRPETLARLARLCELYDPERVVLAADPIRAAAART